ncbi:MAG: C4-type zinc ribbon domain-containing protein [Desulforegulaceae bacterium]|nr:C4-type zinc ribbon domain-containing protein [Desulforegulaceae bacterium]
MNNSVLEQRELMIKLQSYDKKIIELEKVLEKVEDETGKLDQNLRNEELKLEALKEARKEKKKLYNMHEADFESNNQRVEKYEQHLRKLASPKDYRVLQREVDETRKLNEEIQETLFALLEKTEELDLNIKEKEAGFSQLKSLIESQKKDIVKKADSEAKEKQDLELKKAEVSKSLNSKIKEIYYNTIQKSGGVAIVPVVNQVCTGCFLRIPPQILIEIKKADDFIYCPRCHRIVYLEEDRPI